MIAYRFSLALTGMFVFFGSVACDVYDIEPALEAERKKADGGAKSEHLVDVCTEGEVPVHTEEIPKSILDLDDFGNDYKNLVGCAVTDLSGPDAFYAIKVAAGERWHMKVEPESSSVDTVLYLMSVCEPSSCSRVVDVCGPGFEEEVSIDFTRAETFYVGIDTRGGGGEVEFYALKPKCGDGLASHGEACDDGNIVGGDGCDAKCRVELTDASPAEVEPNRDSSEGNTLLPGADGAITVTGNLGGPCDEDHYLIEVPEGGSLIVTMLTALGKACPNPTGAELLLLDSSTNVLLGKGEGGGAGGACPGIDAAFAENLKAGTYQLLLRAPRDTEPFSYSLKVQSVLP